jgi:hypothetical protein
LEWLGSGFESLFGGHDFVPGIQQEAECYIHEMPAGIWTESGLSARSQASCGSTVCPEGLVIVDKTAASGKKQYMCSPTCLEGAKTIQSGGACYAQDNSSAVDGRCQFAGQTVECCDEGQRAFQWGVCSPACIDGYQYWDKQADQCRNCSTGWYPVYQTPGNSIGQCKECPAGQVYDANAAKCEPLECKPPIGYFDAKKPHECAACTPGQIYSASTNKCECSEGTFAKGTACVCPQGATKVTWTATFTCACPEGSTLDTEKFACVCSAGTQIQQVNVGGTIYTSCTPISRCRSNSVRGPDGRCKQCGRGQIAQGSRCVFLTEIRRRLQGLPMPSGSKTVIPGVPVEPCPRGMRRIRGSCVPPKLPPAVTSGPGLRCPPGMVPNVRGTDCVRNVPAATRSVLDPSRIHPGIVGPRPPMSRMTPTPGPTPAPGMMRVAPR